MAAWLEDMGGETRSHLSSQERQTMESRLATVIGALLLIGGSFVTLAGAQIPDPPEDPPASVDVSLGDAYYEDFQDDDGGWDTYAPPAPAISSWEHGEPTSGPGQASLGENVWATNLDGDYLGNECSALVSSPIDLSDASSAEVSYDQWLDTFEPSYGTAEGGALFVSTDGGETFDHVTPEGGYDAELSYSVRDCLDLSYGSEGFVGPDTPSDYESVTLDLDDYVGEEDVRVAIGMGTAYSSTEAGWYVDAFTVTEDGSSTVEDFSTDAGFETQEWTEAEEPTGWEWGEPTTGPSLDDDERKMWATNLGGDYGPNECSWIESPAIDLTPTGNELAALANQATLSWEQWFQSSSLSAGGVVQIGVDGDYTTIAPEDGYPDDADDDLVDCLDNDGIGQYDGNEDSSFQGPSSHQADITGFLGEEITIRYLLGSEDSTYTDPGWYLDNVAVELGVSADLPGEQTATLDHPGWSSDDGDWDWGPVANEGPIGELAYGTNTQGEYAPGPSCSVVETTIDVPVGTEGDLTWDQWLRSSSFSAGGVIQVADDEGVHNIVPEGGYANDPYSLETDDCTQHETQDTGVMNGFEQSTGDPMETWSADLSDWAGEQITLRFVWAVEDTSFTYDGWYVNNVTLDGTPLVAPSPVDLSFLADTNPEDVVADVQASLEENLTAAQSFTDSQPDQYTGWTVGGQHISWAYDEATTGPEGENVTATNPHGVHSEEEYECSYVQSPTVPTAMVGEDLQLSLDHYRDMSYSDGWSSGARTAGSILVSTDGGASWDLLDTDANDMDVQYTRIYDCFAQLGVDGGEDEIEDTGVISGESNAMETLTVDLSEYEDASSIMVRMIFGTGTTVYAQGGWSFNNVSLGDVELME